MSARTVRSRPIAIQIELLPWQYNRTFHIIYHLWLRIPPYNMVSFKRKGEIKKHKLWQACLGWLLLLFSLPSQLRCKSWLLLAVLCWDKGGFEKLGWYLEIYIYSREPVRGSTYFRLQHKADLSYGKQNWNHAYCALFFCAWNNFLFIWNDTCSQGHVG